MQPLNKPIKRKTLKPFMHYRIPLVAELVPGDVISLRLLRHRREVLWSLHDLYYSGLRRDVAREKRAAKKNRSGVRSPERLQYASKH